MMKTILTTLIFCFMCNGYAQVNKIDSLKQQLTVVKQDTSRVMVLIELCNLYRSTYPDSCLMTAEQVLNIARKINFTDGEFRAMWWLGLANRDRGNYTQAFSTALKGLRMAKNYQSPFEIAEFHHLLAICYTDFKDYKNAILNLQTAKTIEENAKLDLRSLNDLAYAYTLDNQIDSASFYAELAYQHALKSKNDFALLTSLRNLGRIQMIQGNYDKALDYYWKSYEMRDKQRNNSSAYKSYIYNLVSEVYLKMNKIDSCIFYAKESLIYNGTFQSRIRKIESYELLAKAYKQKRDFKQAFENLELLNATREELYGASNTQAVQTLLAQDQEQQKQSEIDKIAYQSQLKQFTLLVGLGITLLIGFILYHNNQKEKKAKRVLEKTLTELKSTQAQLIQSEKLASLGELTAGIAHEIQNPLNFVNNFSELSVDLVKDLKDEFKKPEKDEVYIDDLFDDLSQNQEKINHHGKRASSIVKGMLEHSRASTGVKELTDINQLADEYFRLSYHGMRAKDKDFNADFTTDFDENLPKIEVIPQDIGRVLLNLINNAFYAVNQRKLLSNDENYTPSVSVTTKQLENAIEVRVKDNGTGMSESVRAKVFQPFFTTKPTGQGTGLGLSLAYDIVTKGHGGTLEVESTVMLPNTRDDGAEGDKGVGSEFIITLPFKTNG